MCTHYRLEISFLLYLNKENGCLVKLPLIHLEYERESPCGWKYLNFISVFQPALTPRERLKRTTITDYKVRVCSLERTALRSHFQKFNAVNHWTSNKNKQSFGIPSKANIGVLSNRVLICFK